MPASSARRRAGRLVAISLTATTVVGLQAFHSSAHAADKINPATGCGEDSFFDGAASPAAGSTITLNVGANQTFSVVYHDESAINTNPGFAAQYTVSDAGGHVVQSGAPGSSAASAPSGTHDKFNTLLSVNWGPSVPGTYTVAIKAWDGDQNKQGGDCGVASWNVNTPAPPTTVPPSTPQTNVLGETFAQAPPAAAVEGTPALTG